MAKAKNSRKGVKRDTILPGFELTAILDAMSDAVLINDADGNIVFANAEARNSYGVDPLKSSRDDLIHSLSILGADGTPVRADMLPGARALRGEPVKNELYRISRLKGAERPVSVSAAPLYGDGGIIGSMVSWRIPTAVDSSDSKYTPSDEEIQSIALFPEENPFPVMRIGADGTLLYANRACGGVVEGWSCRIGEQAPEKFREAGSTALRDRKTAELELSTGDRFFLFACVPLPERGYVNLYGRDNTERRRAELEKEAALAVLRKSEEIAQRRLEEIEDLYRHAPVGLCVLDTDLRYVRINDYLAKLNGLPAAEHIGKSVRDLLPALADLVEEPMRRVLDTGEALLDVELAGKMTPSGVRGTWRISYSPLRDSTGSISGLNVVVHDITEITRAEEALRKSEALLRAATDNSPDPIFMKDRECRLLFANQATLRLIGKTAGEVMGKTDEEFYENPADGRSIMENDRRIMESGRGEVVEEALSDSDGSTRFFISSKAPLYDGMGKIIGLVGVAHDITERKRAEEELAASQNRIQGLIDNIPAIIYAFDLDERFVLVNASVARLFKTTPEKMLGKRRHEFMPRADADAHEANDRQVIAAGRAVEFEEHSELPDNSITWLTTKFPLRDARGNIYAVAGVSTDITERKRAEEALRASEKRLIGVLESMPDAFVSFDADMRYTYVNANAERLQAARREELLGKDARTVYPDPESYKTISLYEQVVRERKPVTSTTFHAGFDRWVEIRAFPTPDGVSVFFKDVSAQVKAEQGLRESETQFRVLTQNLQSGVALIDERGAFSIVNSSFLKIFDIPQDADILNVNSRDWSQWQVFDERGALLNVDEHPVRKAALTRTPVKNQLAAVKSPYSPDMKWLLVSAEPILDESGKVHRLICTYYDITDRRQAEEALRRSEARWNAAIESFAEGVIIATGDEQVVYWNPAAREMHGFTRPDEGIEPLERTPVTFQLWMPGGGRMLELDEWPMRRIKRGEPVRNLELRIRRPDQGWEKIFSYSGVMVETAGGERLIFLSCRDMTGLRKAEQAVRESEERFRLALKNAPVSVAVQDLDLRYIWAYNQRSARPDQVIGRTDYEIFTPEEAAHFTAVKRRVLDEGIEQREQMWLNRPAGRMYLDICWEPVRDQAGRIAGVASATVDLTPIKLAEEALRQSEEKYRSLFSNMSEGFGLHEILLDDDGKPRDYRFLEVNSAFEKLTGLSGGSLVGRTVLEVLPGTEPYWIENFGRVALTGEPVKFENFSASLGKWFETYAYSAGGNRFAVIFTDITERKAAEESLRASEERFRAMFEEHGAVMLLIEPKTGAIADANTAAAKFYGYSREQLRSMRIEQINQLSPERVAAERQRAVETGKLRFVFPHRLADGEIRWVEVYSSPVAIRGVPMLFSVIHDITARREAEEALERSREDLNRAQEVGHIGSWRLDVRKNELTWSDENHRIFGIPRGAEMSYETFLGTVHPDDREYVDRKWKAALAGEPYDIEHRVIADARVKWVREKAYLEFDEAGELLGGFGITHDITERKSIEEELRERTERYELVVAGSNAAVWDWDVPNRKIFFAPLWKTMRGFEESDIGDREEEWSAGIYPDDVKRVFESVQAHFDGKTPFFQEEYRVRRKDGSWMWIEDRGIALRDAEGNVVRMAGSEIDITSRKKSEEDIRNALESLQASEERYRALVELSPDAILVNRSNRYVLANMAALKLFGADTDEQLLGKSPFDVFLPEYHGRVVERIRRILAGESVPPVEEKILRLDGTVRDVQVVAGRITDRRGPAIQVIFRDITEKKLLEEELLKTQKLESVGLLAGGIAHDFNNLLTAVIGYIAISKVHARSNTQLVDLLEKADEAAGRAAGLTQRLITFSTGGGPLARTVEIQGLVEDATRFSLSGANVGCRFDISGDLNPVKADEGQIRQVVQNIVMNAVEAMPDGGYIDVSASNTRLSGEHALAVPPGDYVKLSFRDHGHGIPHAFLGRVFDPYFSTKERGSAKGMGLGLAICHSIITKHGGAITAESEPGEGTVISVYLPVEAAASGDGSPVHARVLVMDDEELVLDIALEALQSAGYAAVPAKDGAEAMDLFRRARAVGNPFDLVILDLTVPGSMGGIETLQKLKAIDPDVRVIVSSGYLDNPAIRDFQKHGFAAALPKPYKPDSLIEMVSRLAGKGLARPGQ